MKKLLLSLALLTSMSTFASQTITCKTTATSPVSDEFRLEGITTFTISGDSATVSTELKDQNGDVHESEIPGCFVKSTRRSFKIKCPSEELEDATGFRYLVYAKIKKKKMSGVIALNVLLSIGKLECK